MAASFLSILKLLVSRTDDPQLYVLLRQVSRSAREEADATVNHLTPTPWCHPRASGASALARFPAVLHIDISKAPPVTVDDVLSLCKSVKTLVCKSQQLGGRLRSARIEKLTVLRSPVQPPELKIDDLPKLRSYKLEYSASPQLTAGLCNHLITLDLAGYGRGRLTGDDFATICNSPSLRCLRLSHSLEGIEKPLQKLAAMSLLELDVSYNLRSPHVCDEDITALQSMSSLLKLDVSYTKVSSQGLAKLMDLTQLVDLRARACQLYSDHLAGIAANFPQLTRLDFSATWDLTNFEQGLRVGSLAKLETLALSYCLHLDRMRPLASVTSLDISGGTMSPGILRTVAGLTALRSLDLSHFSPHNPVTNATLAALTGLGELTRLDLGGAAGVDDAGMPCIARLAGLSELVLSGSGVTAAGLALLTCLTALRCLKCLQCAVLRLDEGALPSSLRLALFHAHRQQDAKAHLLLR